MSLIQPVAIVLGSSIENTLNIDFFGSLPSEDKALIQDYHYWVSQPVDSSGTDMGSSFTNWDDIGLLSYSDWKTYSKLYNPSTGFLDAPDSSASNSAFWTLTPYYPTSNCVWYVGADGSLNPGTGLTGLEAVQSIRPALYLNPDASVSGDTVIDSDATLATVLSQSISAGPQAGTTSAPIQATIYVTNRVATVAASDIAATESNNATVTFYGTDSAFITPASGSVQTSRKGGRPMFTSRSCRKMDQPPSITR